MDGLQNGSTSTGSGARRCQGALKPFRIIELWGHVSLSPGAKVSPLILSISGHLDVCAQGAFVMYHNPPMLSS